MHQYDILNSRMLKNNNLQKIAILLDFDGPLFNNDAVKIRLKQLYSISDLEWDEAYKASQEGSLYVDYGRIIAILSKVKHKREEEMWNLLYDSALKDTSSTSIINSDLSSEANLAALKLLMRTGKVELITQGHAEYQWLKIFRSGVQILMGEGNSGKIDETSPHSIEVIPKSLFIIS